MRFPFDNCLASSLTRVIIFSPSRVLMISNLTKLKTSVKARTRWILKGEDSASATIQTLFSRFLIVAVNVGTGVITARFLGPEGRGEQAAMILWPIFLANILTFGLPSSVVYNFRKHPQDRSRFFAAALLIGTLAGLVATAIGIIFIPIFLKNYSDSTIQFARLLMFNAPIALVQLIILSALEANEEFSASNRLRLLIPSVTLFLLIGLLITNTLNPYTSALAYILNGVPVFFWTLIQLYRRIKPKWNHISQTTRLLIGYGIRSYGINLLGALASNIDQALVVGFLSPTAMGTYVVALSLSRILNIFQNSFSTVLFPKAAARPINEIIEMTGRATRLNLIAMILIGVVVIIFSQLLLKTLYGSEFVNASSVLRILIIQVVLNGTTMMLAQAFMASGNPGIVTTLQGIGLALNAPLMLILIPSMGLTGAGLSLLTSTIFRLVFVLILFPILFKKLPPSLIISKEDCSYVMQKLFST